MTKTLRALLSILVVLCTLASLIFATVYFTVYNNSFWVNIADDDYVDYVHRYIAVQLEGECLYYGIEPQYLTDYIDDTAIREVSQKYFTDIYAAVSKGSKVQPVTFPTDGYVEGLTALAEKVKSEGDTFDDDAITEIAEDAASVSAVCITSMNVDYINRASKIISNRNIKNLISLWGAFAVVDLIFVVLIIILPKARMRSKLSLASSSVFIPSLLMTITSLLLCKYDFKSKLVFADTPFKQMLDRIIDGVFSIITVSSACVCVLSGIAFITVIILRLKRKEY